MKNALRNKLRTALKDAPHYSERSFEVMIKGFDQDKLVIAVKEARAMLGVGLKDALTFVQKYWGQR